MSCPASDTCRNYSRDDELCQEAEDGHCSNFECSCSLMVYLGSNRHGNYGKCPVCGDEGEI